jgi:squalene-associated FAD-dependent desaturase
MRDKLKILLAWPRIRAEIGSGSGGGREVEINSPDATVEAWLDSHGQTPGSRRGLWHPLAVAALNEDPSRASCRLFAAVLRLCLGEGSAGSRLGIPRVPLGRLVDPALRRYLEGRRGRVLLNAPASKLVLEGGRVRGVRLRDGSEIQASAVVSAVPPHALLRLLPQEVPEKDPFFGRARGMLPSPILSIHLWLDRPVLEVPFLGLLDSPIHWIFNAGRNGEGGPAPSRVALVTSGARDLVDRSGQDLLALASAEVRRYLPRARAANLLHSRVIKERQATFSPRAGESAKRPGPATPISNLFLAGDWTDTGLPGTLESAAVSGHRCADLLEERISGWIEDRK